MANSHNVLFDDGPVVQLFRDVVARSANELDAPVIRLVVGARSDKRRQKRVVNVYYSISIMYNYLLTDDLHVPGQHDQIDLVACQQLEFFPLLFLLIFGTDGKYVK